MCKRTKRKKGNIEIRYKNKKVKSKKIKNKKMFFNKEQEWINTSFRNLFLQNCLPISSVTAASISISSKRWFIYSKKKISNQQPEDGDEEGAMLPPRRQVFLLDQRPTSFRKEFWEKEGNPSLALAFVLALQRVCRGHVHLYIYMYGYIVCECLVVLCLCLFSVYFFVCTCVHWGVFFCYSILF